MTPRDLLAESVLSTKTLLARYLAGDTNANGIMPTSDGDQSSEDAEIERLLGAIERLSEDEARAALVTDKGEAMANERAV